MLGTKGKITRDRATTNESDVSEYSFSVSFKSLIIVVRPSNCLYFILTIMEINNAAARQFLFLGHVLFYLLN